MQQINQIFVNIMSKN